MENGMSDNLINVDFDSIRKWISEHLKSPNDIVHSEGRNVIINTEMGDKYINIPKLTALNKNEWKRAWLDVYESCLDTLQLKVNRIYSIGRREGYISQNGANEVKVGSFVIHIPYDYNSVEYAESLEKIISIYNTVKEREQKTKVYTAPIAVNHTTVKIDNPDELLAKMRAHMAAKNVEPAPNITVKAAHRVPEVTNDNTVNTVRMNLQKNEEPVVNNHTKIHKIPDNVLIDKEDCDLYRNQSLVIASCTSVKHGDGLFRDNIEILKEIIPGINIGSFISGKANNIDQAIKEGGKILRLLNDVNVTDFVIYEVNNDFINSHLKKKETIQDSINAAYKMCDILKEGNYAPVLCMDYDTYENIKNIMNIYEKDYPIIKCITSKQKDLIKENNDILYMNPSNDTDVIMISSSAIKTKMENVPETIIRESYSRQIA